MRTVARYYPEKGSEHFQSHYTQFTPWCKNCPARAYTEIRDACFSDGAASIIPTTDAAAPMTGALRCAVQLRDSQLWGSEGGVGSV